MIHLDEHRVLSEGYIFLRTIEHYLQMMHYRQTHSLPEDAASMESWPNAWDLAVKILERNSSSGMNSTALPSARCICGMLEVP